MPGSFIPLSPVRPDAKRISISLDADLIAVIDRLAIRYGCSRSALVGFACLDYVQRFNGSFGDLLAGSDAGTAEGEH